MRAEDHVRIPSGCAIAAVISKDGNRMSGKMICEAMKPMHDRSNGLGGGSIRSASDVVKAIALGADALLFRYGCTACHGLPSVPHLSER